MPYQIRIKRSETPGAVPASLAFGELAFNFADRILYIGDRNGNAIQVVSTEQVVPFESPELIEQPPEITATQTGYTTNGVRRRLLPFE